MIKYTFYLLLLFISLACKRAADKNMAVQNRSAYRTDTIAPPPAVDSQQTMPALTSGQVVKDLTGHELVNFAKTLSGIPYCYASIDPAKGFDCSGFITYVFNHFNMVVPRSSVDFTNVGRTVYLQSAREGDLILFTGTVDTIRVVGHMGIVTENIDTLQFIHATSGKANGVTISLLNEHYIKRFVKIIRVLAD